MILKILPTKDDFVFKNKRLVTKSLSHPTAGKGQVNLAEMNTNSILSTPSLPETHSISCILYPEAESFKTVLKGMLNGSSKQKGRQGPGPHHSNGTYWISACLNICRSFRIALVHWYANYVRVDPRHRYGFFSVLLLWQIGPCHHQGQSSYRTRESKTPFYGRETSTENRCP